MKLISYLKNLKNTPYIKSVSAFRVEIIASRAIIVVNASSNCQLNSICLNQICDPEIINCFISVSKGI